MYYAREAAPIKGLPGIAQHRREAQPDNTQASPVNSENNEWASMNKRKKSASLHSLAFERLNSGRGAQHANEQSGARGRQRNSAKNDGPRRRVRIAVFSTWGSDYRQIDLSATVFGGIIIAILLTIGGLTVAATLGVTRLIQYYRLSVLSENQQVMRNRLSQAEARVTNLVQRADGIGEGGNFGLIDGQDRSGLPAFHQTPEPENNKSQDLVEIGRTKRDSLRKRGPLGLEWTDGGESPEENPNHASADPDGASSLFYGQGGGAYIDEDDNIYPTLLEKERIHPSSLTTISEKNHSAAEKATNGNDLLSDLERQVSETQELQKTIAEKFEIRRKQLEHIPSIKPLLNGRITDLFGKRIDPFVARTRHHQGLDIGAPRGTEVFAPANGVVEFVKTTYRRNRGYGRAVVVNHGYGIKTLYGHLSKINVKVGQRIERWDIVGLVGETGRATGPHLHYEVWVDGQVQDPLRFILNN
jgi:hypothetical protein